MRQKKRTAFENSVRMMKRCIKERDQLYVTELKKLNTGSYKYILYADWYRGRGLCFVIEKYGMNDEDLGILKISNYSIEGCEYNQSVIGKVPNSLIKIIIDFAKAMNN